MIKTKSGLRIIIRQENPDDYKEIDSLVYNAFATQKQFDIVEYLNEIRKKDTFIKELSFVATLSNGKIIGQITLYKTDIITYTGKITQLVLSPICVLPEFFNNGIASEMINFALNKTIGLGYTAVFLHGDPKFYKRFGFEPTYKYNIYHETDIKKKSEYFMVKTLSYNALNGISGITYYD